MKLTVKTLLLAACVCSLLIYSGCKSKTQAESTQDKQIDLLNKSWVVSTVTREGIDQSAHYTGADSTFVLTFTGTHGSTTIPYTTSKRPKLSPWDASGTFTLDATSPQTLMTRNDSGDPISFSYSVTATQLQLSFDYEGDGFAGGRVKQIKGNWIFNMIPKP